MVDGYWGTSSPFTIMYVVSINRSIAEFEASTSHRAVGQDTDGTEIVYNGYMDCRYNCTTMLITAHQFCTATALAYLAASLMGA